MSQQIQITGGAKVRNLEGVLTGTAGVVNALGINVPSGIPQLDGSGKILVSQLPNSVMEYKGTWNAATNTPTLVNGTGNQGDVYLCNVAGTVNFGAGAITFAVGDQAIYSGTIWQKAGGSTGTVTSVAITETGDALTITGSPITTSGTINIGFAGTSGQYVNGAGGLTTFPTLISSIGLSMPSAFTVTNSPLTANGTIAVTGAGTTAQYVRGDGSLATFPTVANEAERLITEVYNDSGATLTKGTVVYINGGQGNLPTVAKALATGDATSAQTYGVVQTDITNMNNGFVVVIGSLTDLDTQAYANGTQLYLSSTVAGAWTSVKQYAPAHLVYVAIVTRSHPTQGVVEVRIQNGFEMDELHNVAAQSPSNGDILQYVSSTSLWTKTAGTTTNIAEGTNLYFTDTRARNAISLTTTGTSGVATYSGGVLNIPNYGSALSGYVPYTGATAGLNLGTFGIGCGAIGSSGIALSQSSGVSASSGRTTINGDANGIYINPVTASTNFLSFPASGSRTYTYPNATGTLALTSDLSAYLPLTGGTLSGALNINLNSGTGLNVSTENVVFRASPTYGSPRQIMFTMGSGPTTTLEAKGYGANYITDFNIKTYNASGTAFDVFFGTAQGDVGIGTNSPTSKLNVVNTDSSTNTIASFSANNLTQQTEIWYGGIRMGGSNANVDLNLASKGASYMSFQTNSTERMRITSGGNVGIGTSSPNDKLDVVSGKIRVSSTTNTLYYGTIEHDAASTGANIYNSVDSGGHIFQTNSTERMRITSVGQLQLKQDGNTFTDGLRLINTSTNNWGIVAGGDNNFYFGYNATSVANINYVTGVYSPLSDFNKKKDFEQSNIGLEAILGLKPTLYRMISDETEGDKELGFIAQEVKEFIPQAYSTSINGDETFIGLNYNAIVAALVKAIQELKAEIDELKNK